MSTRTQIEMTPEEVGAFLAEQKILSCASIGIRGWPHLVPLWYVPRGEELWAWTYAKSQKVRNLERDPRATLQVETGRQYHELRGVMIEAQANIHRQLEVVASVGSELFSRYNDAVAGPEVIEAIRAQAAKRVALQFAPQRVASWDHRKLGGKY